MELHGTGPRGARVTFSYLLWVILAGVKTPSKGKKHVEPSCVEIKDVNKQVMGISFQNHLFIPNLFLENTFKWVFFPFLPCKPKHNFPLSSNLTLWYKMLIKHFPAFPVENHSKRSLENIFFSLWKVHSTGGLTWLSATLGTNCPWFIRNYLGSYDSRLLHNSSQVTGSEVPFPDPGTSGTAGWPWMAFHSLLKEQKSCSSSPASPLLGFWECGVTAGKVEHFPSLPWKSCICGVGDGIGAFSGIFQFHVRRN